MIITKTPYRISLFGGGTDHPSWYKKHGGEVISFAIDKYWLQLQKQDRWMLLVPITVVQKPDYSDIEKKYTDYQRIMSSVDKSEFRK